MQNFISRKGVRERRDRNNQQSYMLASEVSYEELKALQTALEFSSYEEIDLKSLEVGEANQMVDGYNAYNIQG